MYKVMVVEDDAALAAELAAGLGRWGFDICSVEMFDQVTDFFQAEQPQLVLMDVNLPYYDGFWWCARIRELSRVPIVFLSSRDDQMDIVMAVQAGADDYITKPFSMNVLVAKLQAVLRRSYSWTPDNVECLSHEGLMLLPGESAAVHEDKRVSLTRNEVKLLSLLMRQSGRVVSRDCLMEWLWEDSVYVNDNTLTANLGRLRGKLAELGLPEYVQTRKGKGYVIP